uniref:Uncharacterized protein n=1 Tax=Leptobrachium leishanense TaxID=445787 RepID=A0A8C5R946_9ANUR
MMCCFLVLLLFNPRGPVPFPPIAVDLLSMSISGPTMARSLLCLLLVFALGYAAKQKREPLEWDYRTEAEKVNMRGCANLTVVLDNWKFAIMTQFRNLLLYDHHTVLPDYGRIKSLSEALDDLYKEFNALKERLGELTTKFDSVEALVDDINGRRQTLPPKPPAPVEQPGSVPGLQLSPGILGAYENRKVKKTRFSGKP